MQPPKFVMFAIPSYSAQCAIEFCGSVAQTVGHLYEAQIPHAFRFRPGLCFIDVVRNLLTYEFLKEFPTATDIFFLDDDIGFEPRKALEFIQRPEDIVCGVYPKKEDNPSFPVTMFVDDNKKLVKRNGLYKAMNIPGGFVRVKRHVMEKLASQAETYKFYDPKNQGEVEIWNIFEARPITGHYWGEDSIFTKKCIDAGFDVWVDPDISFTHRGNKRWEGKLKPHLDQTEAMMANPDLPPKEGLNPGMMCELGEVATIEKSKALLKAVA